MTIFGNDMCYNIALFTVFLLVLLYILNRPYFKENFDEDSLIDDLIKHFECLIIKGKN